MFIRVGHEVVLNVWGLVNNFLTGFSWGLGTAMALTLWFLAINMLGSFEKKKKEKKSD